MIELEAWPLDNKRYTSVALGAAYAARSRGLLTANSFTLTTNGDNTLTLDKGLGCLNVSEFWACFPYSPGDVIVQFEDADGVYEDCLYYRPYTEEDKQEALHEKLAELSAACEAAINSGTKVRFSDGSERLVTYDIKNQTNIKELFDAVRMGATAYLFHTPSGDCMMYSAADIIAMYSTLAGYKTAQLTYHNKLKQYVESLGTVPAIQAVQYGDPLTGEWLEGYNTLIAEAEVVLQAILQGVMQSGG